MKGISIIFSMLIILAFTVDTRAQQPKSYLALGDSYTICESIDESNQWPKQLVERLKENDIDVSQPRIIAKTGWRTDNLLDAAEGEVLTTQFDLVSLLIGVNNEFQGWPIEKFRPEFEKCVNYAIEHCKTGSKGVFILSIPDYGYTPYGKSNQTKISTRIDQYNAICKEVAVKNNIAYYDITSISREGLKKSGYVAKDGLHPSAEQYKAWITKYITDIAAQIKAL